MTDPHLQPKPDDPSNPRRSAESAGKSGVRPPGEQLHVIRLSSDNFDRLLFALGYAGGCAVKDGDLAKFRSLLQLANAINEGNPHWRPYNVDLEVAADLAALRTRDALVMGMANRESGYSLKPS